jgi:hypothetical protein
VRRLAILLAGLLALLGASPAHASITLGQLAPSGATTTTCGPTSGSYTQPTVTSGRSYVVPATGRITSWSTAAVSGANQEMSLKIFRPLGGADYLALSHDGPRPLTPSAVNTFPANLAVKPGDVLGVNTDGTGGIVGCRFEVPGETSWGSFPESPEDGESATFLPAGAYRLNVTAEFEPSNDFSLASTRRNKKKGQATITVNLSGPGTAALGGKGLKGQSATLATATGGSVDLKVIAKGKARKKLRARGKARVNPSVTFTPTGGAAATQSESVKLIRKG